MTAATSQFCVADADYATAGSCIELLSSGSNDEPSLEPAGYEDLVSSAAATARHDVAASTQNQAFNAIAVFHKPVLGSPSPTVDALRAKCPAHPRHTPTIAESRALPQAVGDVGFSLSSPTRQATDHGHPGGMRFFRPLAS